MYGAYFRNAGSEAYSNTSGASDSRNGLSMSLAVTISVGCTDSGKRMAPWSDCRTSDAGVV